MNKSKDGNNFKFTDLDPEIFYQNEHDGDLGGIRNLELDHISVAESKKDDQDNPQIEIASNYSNDLQLESNSSNSRKGSFLSTPDRTIKSKI